MDIIFKYKRSGDRDIFETIDKQNNIYKIEINFKINEAGLPEMMFSVFCNNKFIINANGLRCATETIIDLISGK